MESNKWRPDPEKMGFVVLDEMSPFTSAMMEEISTLPDSTHRHKAYILDLPTEVGGVSPIHKAAIERSARDEIDAALYSAFALGDHWEKDPPEDVHIRVDQETPFEWRSLGATSLFDNLTEDMKRWAKEMAEQERKFQEACVRSAETIGISISEAAAAISEGMAMAGLSLEQILACFNMAAVEEMKTWFPRDPLPRPPRSLGCRPNTKGFDQVTPRARSCVHRRRG